MNNENNQNQNVSVPNNGGVTPVGVPVTPVTPAVPDANSTPVAPVMPEVGPVDSNVVENNAPDENAVVNENLKKVEINYTPPSKFKIFCLVCFFILLIAFVLFLPEISSYIRMAQSGELNQEEEVITTGILDCSLSTQTTNLDKKYEVSYSFADSKLETMQFVITTRGDVTLDANVLDEMNANCKSLSQSVKKLNGVQVNCNYTNDTLVEKRFFKLEEVDTEQLDTVFTEAGVNAPGYTYGQNIDKIEQQMNASKYSCQRRHSS